MMSFLERSLKGVINIVGYFFLLLVAMGHPYLVMRIVSQLEAPPLTRLGLVLLSYPVLFLLIFIMYHLPDSGERNDSGEAAIAIGTLFLMCFVFMLYVGAEAWQELLFRHRLLHEGQFHAATIRRCERVKNSRSTNCYMSYKYQVPAPNGVLKTYIIREDIDCEKERKCFVGDSVDISYLPHMPDQAGILGNRSRLEGMIFLFMIFFDGIFYLFIPSLWPFVRRKLGER